MTCGCLVLYLHMSFTCPLAKPQSRREQSWLMLRAETAPKSAPVALVPRQSRRAWLVSGGWKTKRMFYYGYGAGLRWIFSFKKSNTQTKKALPSSRNKRQRKHQCENTIHTGKWSARNALKLLVTSTHQFKSSNKVWRKTTGLLNKNKHEAWHSRLVKRKKKDTISNISEREDHTFSCAGIIMMSAL